MDLLIEKYYEKVRSVDTRFIRSAMRWLDSDDRCIGLKGPRGVGKTTLLLQYARQQPQWRDKVLYVSLDNIWFSNQRLYELVDEFVKRGGEQLLLDEVHKYPNWSQEVKNIYDDWPGLRIIFTGSSLLEIINARADLSRRAVIYNMHGLSFREYLVLQTGKSLPAIDLPTLLEKHVQWAEHIVDKVKPLQYFSQYLKGGYYPFFIESGESYHQKLEEVINLVLETELPLLRKVDVAYVPRLKQILAIIAESVPFVPNMTKLSERIGINRRTLLTYIYYLQEAGLIHNLYKAAQGISQLQKPQKIFLDNPNLAYTFSNKVDQGMLRETFFTNQVKVNHEVRYAHAGDFEVDNNWVFEIGGKNKGFKQKEGLPNGYLAVDGLEYGHGRKIPLWLFGFLY